MNFKIENNFLDITNYPSMEKHFEDMAKKGWLISKIFTGSLFVYKKIEEEKLDFSITPYEVETEFTKKSKEELEEFKSVCEFVGWNYATKSYDLHIYYKGKASKATPIQTDEEEEFKTLEKIAKKRIRFHYIVLPFLLLLSWFLLGGIFNSINTMKDGFSQIIGFLFPFVIVLSIFSIVHFKNFLKINRENMELGKGIKYSNSKFMIPKIILPIYIIALLLMIFYILYMTVILKNNIMLIAFLPALIGLTVGTLFRIFVKPSKKTLRVKKIGLFVALIAAVIISIGFSIFAMTNMSCGPDEKKGPTLEGYKFLSIADFPEETLAYEGSLRKQKSFLIPESYDYYFSSEESRGIGTEYSRALTENLAKELVSRYIKQSENALVGRYSREKDLYFAHGVHEDYLLRAGLTIEDLNTLKNKNYKEVDKIVIEIIKERAITKDDENLWKLEEVYFLNSEKDEVVIRNGKEVYYLEGLDFSDEEIIRKVKNKLKL